MIFKNWKKILKDPSSYLLLFYIVVSISLALSFHDDIIRFSLINKSDLQEITIKHVTYLVSAKTRNSKSSLDMVRIFQPGDIRRYHASCFGAEQFCGVHQVTELQDATIVLLWAPNSGDISPEHPRGPIKYGFIKEMSEKGEIIFKNNEDALDTFISTQHEKYILRWILYIFGWVSSIWCLYLMLRPLFKEEE